MTPDTTTPEGRRAVEEAYRKGATIEVCCKNARPQWHGWRETTPWWIWGSYDYRIAEVRRLREEQVNAEEFSERDKGRIAELSERIIGWQKEAARLRIENRDIKQQHGCELSTLRSELQKLHEHVKDRDAMAKNCSHFADELRIAEYECAQLHSELQTAEGLIHALSTIVPNSTSATLEIARDFLNRKKEVNKPHVEAMVAKGISELDMTDPLIRRSVELWKQETGHFEALTSFSAEELK